MENKKNNELNISDLLNIFTAKWSVILIAGLLSAAVAFGYTSLFIVPQYRASAQMFVDARSDENSVITSAQLSTAKQLVLTYAEVIETNSILNTVIDELSLEENYKQLQQKVNVQVVQDTQILKINVTDPDPEKALRIVEKIVEVTPVVLNQKMSSSKIGPIDDPDVTSSPISPNVTRNTVVGLLIGVVLVYGYFLVKKLLDNKFKSAEDIQKVLDLPALGVIPIVDNSISSK